MPARLHALYVEMKEFCNRNKLLLHMNDLNRNLLSYERACDFPCGKLNSNSQDFLDNYAFLFETFEKSSKDTFCKVFLPRSWFKGADTRAVCTFLEHKYGVIVESGQDPPHLPYVTAIWEALVSGNDFLRRLYRGHLFLGKIEAKRLAKQGRLLLTHYNLAAQHAYSLGYCRFKFAPKQHAFSHVVHRLEASCSLEWTLNPCSYMCQLDEDVVGQVSTLSKSCSIRRVHENTLRKYLVKVRLCMTPEPEGRAKASRVKQSKGKRC